jgi:hypothetical protein
MMHAANFLHRDIAPDNIIIRPDGSPVLLDFGAARRAVAEMSRSLTGIVKAGYSPHEQYSSDGRLQGPWSDLYALGGTLYRAVVGKPPEEATLRFDEDQMASAAQMAKGRYRPDFLAAIDACLKVRHAERPRSVAQLRPMLLGADFEQRGGERLVETYKLPSARILSMPRSARVQQVVRRWPAIAAAIIVILGIVGGYEYRRQSLAQKDDAQPGLDAQTADARRRLAEIEEAKRKEEGRIASFEEAKRKEEQARRDAEEEKRRQAAAAEAQRQAELRRKAEEEKRTAETTAEEKRRIAAAEEAKRKDEARHKADEEKRLADIAAEEKRRIALMEENIRKEQTRQLEEENRRNEQARIAALDQKRKDDETRRLQAVPSDTERISLVKRVQEVLKRGKCYEGEANGSGNDAQDGLDEFVRAAHRAGKTTPKRIELAKATVGDFETWLKDADGVGSSCSLTKAPVAKAPSPPAAAVTKPVIHQEKAVEKPARIVRPRPAGGGGGGYSGGGYSSGGGGYSGGGGGAPVIQGIR